MHVSQGPVIHTAFFQVGHTARGIRRLGSADLGMKEPDGIAVGSSPAEVPGQIVPLLAFGITLAVYGSQFFPVYDEGNPFDLFRAKDVYIGRKGNPRLPGFQRIVIAQYGKHLYVMLGQLVQKAHIVELCRQVVAAAGIDITGNQHGIDFFINRRLDDFLKGPDRRLADDTLPAFIDHGNIMKGTAQMQIPAMYKTQTFGH